MIIREKTLLFHGDFTISCLQRQQDSVFFDIETTGLAWRYSRLYLIGAVFFREGRWHMRQWFLESPLEEPRLLRTFSEFLKPFSAVIHYNGQGFDLPYLIHKYEDYQLADPFSGLKSVDLYRAFRPWKKIFGLTSLKQKDAERFLGLSRQDACSGGELISCYEEYLKTASPELLELLLLHNHDDVLGLTGLLPLLNYSSLPDGRYAFRNAEFKKGELSLSLTLDDPIPVPFSLEQPPFRLDARGDEALLRAESFSGEMKHFFDNWKDYYYLPLEDCAVHKSVGMYVDRDCRKKATARTCYQRTSGQFLPQPEILFRPAFYREYGASPSWFLFHREFLADRGSLDRYARSVLNSLLD